MSLIQEINNGQVLNDKMNTDKDAAATKSSTDSTKEMFLKLLVTEMQYQDPLQPTDNSEYVKEMATFSQVEAVNSIKGDMTAMQANTLVGKCVTVTDENDREVTGIVDYVTKDSPPMLSVEGNLYSMDDVKTVQEPTYYEAVTMSETFQDMLSKLPNVNYLTLSDKSAIQEAANVYDSMTDYQKTFVPESSVKQLTTLVTRLNELLKTAEETEQKKKEEEAAKAASTNTTDQNGTDNTGSAAASTTDTTGSTGTTATDNNSASATTATGNSSAGTTTATGGSAGTTATTP